MHFNTHTLAFAALSASHLVAAQTFSACDPTKGDKCPPNKAFGNCNKATEYDFTKVKGGAGWKTDDLFKDFWLADGGVLNDDSQLQIDGTNGAQLIITKKEQAPLIKSKQYIFFGKVEVTLQAAKGQGIVTSVVLESDDRDEHDWEFLGGRQNIVQTNYFSKGVNEYIHGNETVLSFNPMEGLHTYTIDWTPEYVAFSVDGAEIRRSFSASEDPKKWPQTPTQVKLGTWVGGKDTLPKGTIEWAGGLADFSQAPFVAFYKSVRITDYCGGYSAAEEYVYSDSSGDAKSIEVKGAGESVGFGGEQKGADSEDDKDQKTKDGDSSSASLKPTESKSSSGKEPSNTGTAPAQKTDAPGAGSVTRLSSTLAGLAFLGYLVLV